MLDWITASPPALEVGAVALFSDTAVVEQTKSLAARADEVIQLADENGKSPEAAAALLAMGEEIAGALTKLSRCVQAHSILSTSIEALCSRAESMQRTCGISEVAMDAAFDWPAADLSAWGDLVDFDGVAMNADLCIAE